MQLSLRQRVALCMAIPGWTETVWRFGRAEPNVTRHIHAGRRQLHAHLDADPASSPPVD